MCDVLFIVPSTKKNLTYESVGTLLLATILKNNDVNTDIYRFYEADITAGFDAFVNKSVSNILAKSPKIVSFYCRCDYFLANIKIAEIIKAKQPEIYIVFGGPQADASCENILKEFPWIDYCCCGEGEQTVYPLFSALLNGSDITSIKGLVYRNDKGEPVCNPRPELIEDLDNIPFIDYSFIDPALIAEASEINHPFPMEVGRGCPFNCAYCSTSLFWQRKFRLKSSKRIVEEMKQINDSFGINHFSFNHDLFTANKNKVLDFCQILKDSGLSFVWACSSRIDTLDEQTIKAMADAGLKWVFLGVESGSERMQKLIHKNLRMHDVIRISELLCKYNIIPTVSFMYGFPEETEEDVEQTLQIANKLLKIGVKSFQFHLCTITPGTEYYNKYKNELVFSETYSNHTGSFGVKENIDFIHKHKSLFPFFYEYHSELRDTLAQFNTHYALASIYAFNKLTAIDPELYSKIRIIDVYKTCVANSTELDKEKSLASIIDDVSNKILPSLYTGQKLLIAKELLAFIRDNQIISSNPFDMVDIKEYDVDIKAYKSGKTLSQLELCKTMVYFKKSNNKISYIFRKI